MRDSMCVWVCVCVRAHRWMHSGWLGVCLCVFMHAGVHAVDHWIQCLLVLCNFDPSDLYILFHNRTTLLWCKSNKSTAQTHAMRCILTPVTGVIIFILFFYSVLKQKLLMFEFFSLESCIWVTIITFPKQVIGIHYNIIIGAFQWKTGLFRLLTT